MTSSKRRFFSGNTVEQALVQAAGYFKIEPGRIAYREVEKRHGFVKVRRRVVIQVDPENPERLGGGPAAAAPPAPEPSAAAAPWPAPPAAPASAAPAPASAAPAPTPASAAPAPAVASAPAAASPPAPAPAAPPHWREEEPRRPESRGAERKAAFRGEDEEEDGGQGGASLDPADYWDEEPPDSSREVTPEEMLAGAREAAERILRLAGLDLAAAVTQGEERLEINLTGPDRERLLEEDGELLQAVEQLLPRVMRGLIGTTPSCRVDCGGFRRDREEQLRRLAEGAAEVLRLGGRAVELEMMAPGERRIVHLTLAEAPGVRTESEGEGFYKRVVIRREE